MNSHTVDYTVTGTGTISCSTREDYTTCMDNFAGDTRFEVTASDPVARTISYSINFTVSE